MKGSHIYGNTILRSVWLVIVLGASIIATQCAERQRINLPRIIQRKCVKGCSESDLAALNLLRGRELSGSQPVPETGTIPSWVNLSLVEVGQKFAQKNSGQLGFMHTSALIFDNIHPDIKYVLFATGCSSSVESSVMRYAATETQVLLWYWNSPRDPHQWRVMLQSLRKVRELHLHASFLVQQRLRNETFLERKGDEAIHQILSQKRHGLSNDERMWKAVYKDILYSHIPQERRIFPEKWDPHGIPISQFSLSLVQFSFAGMAILFQEQYGIVDVTEEELRGFTHLWALIGHNLGIEKEFNICLEGNWQFQKELFQSIINMYYIPSLFQMEKTSFILISTLLDALQTLHPYAKPGLLIYKFLRDVVRIHPKHTFNTLNIVERMYIAGMEGVLDKRTMGMWNRWATNSFANFDLRVNLAKYYGGNWDLPDDTISKFVYFKAKTDNHDSKCGIERRRNSFYN